MRIVEPELGPDTADTTAVVDLRPRLQRKRAADCKHRVCSVDDTAASLTCDDCESEIDPWWFIRRQARERDELHEEFDREFAAQTARIAGGNATIARMNETIARLNGEIAELTERKNRLWNTQVNGVALVNYRKVRSKRAP